MARDAKDGTGGKERAEKANTDKAERGGKGEAKGDRGAGKADKAGGTKGDKAGKERGAAEKGARDKPAREPSDRRTADRDRGDRGGRDKGARDKGERSREGGSGRASSGGRDRAGGSRPAGKGDGRGGGNARGRDANAGRGTGARSSGQSRPAEKAKGQRSEKNVSSGALKERSKSSRDAKSEARLRGETERALKVAESVAQGRDLKDAWNDAGLTSSHEAKTETTTRGRWRETTVVVRNRETGDVVAVHRRENLIGGYSQTRVDARAGDTGNRYRDNLGGGYGGGAGGTGAGTGAGTGTGDGGFGGGGLGGGGTGTGASGVDVGLAAGPPNPDRQSVPIAPFTQDERSAPDPKAAKPPREKVAPAPRPQPTRSSEPPSAPPRAEASPKPPAEKRPSSRPERDPLPDHGGEPPEPSAGQVAADLVTSFTPGVSWARDAYEAGTGRDLITSESLNLLGRGFAVAGVLSGGTLSKLRRLPAFLRAARQLQKARVTNSRIRRVLRLASGRDSSIQIGFDRNLDGLSHYEERLIERLGESYTKDLADDKIDDVIDSYDSVFWDKQHSSMYFLGKEPVTIGDKVGVVGVPVNVDRMVRKSAIIETRSRSELLGTKIEGTSVDRFVEVKVPKVPEAE